MAIQFSIPIKDFQLPTPAEAKWLASLAEYEAMQSWPQDCHALADMLKDSDPFTLLLFAEPLAREHWRRKTHTSMRRVAWGSELDETVYRNFGNKINTRMAEWLRDHTDPNNDHLQAFMREYYPQARRILRDEYEERHPKT